MVTQLTTHTHYTPTNTHCTTPTSTAPPHTAPTPTAPHPYPHQCTHTHTHCTHRHPHPHCITPTPSTPTRARTPIQPHKISEVQQNWICVYVIKKSFLNFCACVLSTVLVAKVQVTERKKRDSQCHPAGKKRDFLKNGFMPLRRFNRAGGRQFPSNAITRLQMIIPHRLSGLADNCKLRQNSFTTR